MKDELGGGGDTLLSTFEKKWIALQLEKVGVVEIC